MCPRASKDHDGKVPRWLYKSNKARIKSVLFGPYECPSCGSQSLVINVDKRSESVLAKCTCGFSQDLPFHSQFQPIDYYGKLIDNQYEKSNK